MEEKSISRTTLLLMAASRLYRSEIASDVEERLTHPYKADLDESGIDLKVLNQELVNGRLSYLVKSTLVVLVAVVGFSLFVSERRPDEATLINTLIGLFLIEFWYIVSAKKRIRKILFDLVSARSVPDLLESGSNKLIVSGGYSPFLGAGSDLDSWSFTVNLSDSAEKTKPTIKFSPEEIHDRIKARLLDIGMDDMSVSEQLFVNGRDINLISGLQPKGRFAKPEITITDELLKDKMYKSDKLQRHYTVVKIPLWDRQIIISMFFRLVIVKDILFVESRFFLLKPLKEKYLNIENLPEKKRFRENVSNALLAAIKAPFTWLWSIIQFLGFVQNSITGGSNKVKQWRKEVEDTRLYNYGWDVSLREKWSSTGFERYFQQVDQDLNLKLLTNEFLTAMLDFLEEKNVSTEQFRATSTKIINEGVMISGGEVKAGSLAVGKGSKIVDKAMNTVKRGAVT